MKVALAEGMLHTRQSCRIHRSPDGSVGKDAVNQSPHPGKANQKCTPMRRTLGSLYCGRCWKIQKPTASQAHRNAKNTDGYDLYQLMPHTDYLLYARNEGRSETKSANASKPKHWTQDGLTLVGRKPLSPTLSPRKPVQERNQQRHPIHEFQSAFALLGKSWPPWDPLQDCRTMTQLSCCTAPQQLSHGELRCDRMQDRADGRSGGTQQHGNRTQAMSVVVPWVFQTQDLGECICQKTDDASLTN